MAGITLERAEKHLDMWLAAEESVARNQSYEMDGRKLTRADAGEISRMVTIWNNRVIRLSKGGIRVRLGVPE